VSTASQGDDTLQSFEMEHMRALMRHDACVSCVLQLEDTPEHFKTILKAGGIMDIVECYPWDGREVLHKRRDKRRGQHTGRVVRKEDGPAIEYEPWQLNDYAAEFCGLEFVIV
jgi:hypothetical protein